MRYIHASIDIKKSYLVDVRDREEGLVLALYEKIAFRRFRTNKLEAHLYL